MIVLGLGSNLGDREDNLCRAVAALDAHPSIAVRACSSVYETEPYGVSGQPEYLNAVAVVATDLPPRALLEACLEIERRLGRRRGARWQARTLDIDILVYEDVTSDDPALTLPHPYLHRRNFVLAPLAEIAPGLVVYRGLTAAAAAAQCEDVCRVRRYGRPFCLQGGGADGETR